MSSADLILIAVAVVASIAVTGATFLIARFFKLRPSLRRAISPVSFPAALIAIIVYVEVRGTDPHGLVMNVLGLMALLTLPFTILTTVYLSRRFVA